MTVSEIKKDKVLSALIALFVITDMYVIQVGVTVSMGEISLIISMLYLAITRGKIRVYKNTLLALFTITSIILTIFISVVLRVNISEPAIRLIRDGFYWVLVYCVCYSYLDYEVFKKWIIRLCFFGSILIILQEVVFVTTGYLIPGYLLNTKVTSSSTGRMIYDHTIVLARRNGYLKASGFLSEGAHSAQMLTIGMIPLLEDEISKKELKLLVLFSFAAILTFSASSYVYIFAVWCLIAFRFIKHGKIDLVVKIGLISISVMIVFLIFVQRFGINIDSIINRLFTSVSADSADRSSFHRLYKGFEFWSRLPIENKILGIGFGNYSNLKGLYSGSSIELLDNEYMNSMSYILVSAGVIGFALFIGFFVGLFRQCNENGKIAIFILGLMFISASPYNSPNWVWLMTIILYNRKQYTGG